MADKQIRSYWHEAIAAIIVAVVIASAHKFGILKIGGDDKTIITALTAAVGLIVALALRLIRPGSVEEPGREEEDEKSEEQSAQADARQEGWRLRYNNLVRLHNRLVESRKRWIEFADEQFARAELLRLNSRAFRVALYFAIWSLLVSITIPPASDSGASAAWAADVRHDIALLIGALVIPVLLVAEVARESPVSSLRLAFRVGLLGLGGCGLITIAVSLPYRWTALSHVTDPVFRMPAAYSILLLRLFIFPSAAFLACALFFANRKVKRKPAGALPQPHPA